ncbi:MAG: LacI family DNA-binding transcriptional regulator [Chloroflexota bacterium]
MKLKSPTMYDVARLAGVSQPTVSRVLSQSEDVSQISKETRRRVLAAVEQLGYRPNAVARSLRTQKTRTIALLLADLSNGFYHPIARAVQKIAREHDYEVLISSSDHLHENEIHFCEIVLSRGIDGVLMAPQRLTMEELSHYVSQTNIPFVALGEHVDHPNIDIVFVDDEKATYETTRWLIEERGHRRIGYFGVPPFLPPGPGRTRGFLRAMEEAGLSVNPNHMQEGDFTLESGKQAARALLATGGNLPTALMVINDLMAIGAILTLQEAGLRVPDDIAVVGFDDIPEATIVRPALTTIAQDAYDIGQKMATALFERIENPDIGERRVYESTYKLIPRQSA